MNTTQAAQSQATQEAVEPSLSSLAIYLGRGLGQAEQFFTKEELVALLKVFKLLNKRVTAGYKLSLRDLERTLPEIENLIETLTGG